MNMATTYNIEKRWSWKHGNLGASDLPKVLKDPPLHLAISLSHLRQSIHPSPTATLLSRPWPVGRRHGHQGPASVFHQTLPHGSGSDSCYTLGISYVTQPTVLLPLPQGLSSSLLNYNQREPYKLQEQWRHLSSETCEVGVQTIQDFVGHNGTPNFRVKVMLLLSPPTHTLCGKIPLELKSYVFSKSETIKIYVTHISKVKKKVSCVKKIK